MRQSGLQAANHHYPSTPESLYQYYFYVVFYASIPICVSR